MSKSYYIIETKFGEINKCLCKLPSGKYYWTRSFTAKHALRYPDRLAGNYELQRLIIEDLIPGNPKEELRVEEHFNMDDYYVGIDTALPDSLAPIAYLTNPKKDWLGDLLKTYNYFKNNKAIIMENLQTAQLVSNPNIKPFLDRLYENLYMKRAFLNEAIIILEKHKKDIQEGIDFPDKPSGIVLNLKDALDIARNTIDMLLSERVTMAQAELAKADEMIELYLKTINN